MDTTGKIIYKKKLQILGGSYALIIPSELAKMMELDANTEIGLVFDEDRDGKKGVFWKLYKKK